MITIDLEHPSCKIVETDNVQWYEGNAPAIGTTYKIYGEVWKPPFALIDCYVYKWDYTSKEWRHEKTLSGLTMPVPYKYEVNFDVYSYFLGAYGLEGWWAFISTKRIRGEQSKWAMLHVVR